MAVENALKCLTFEASGDLSGEQYRFVKLDSSSQVAVAGNGELASGVLQNDPDAAGKAATVAVFGQTKIRFGATVAAGADVASDANGDAVDATSAEFILGVCVEGGDSGEIGSMLFQPHGKV